MADKSITEQLKQLHDLKQKGILSDTEFNEQKTKILAQTSKAQPASFSPPVQQDALVIGVNSFISKNKFILTGLFTVISIGFGVYYFLFMPNPERDAKATRQAQCDCAQKSVDELMKIDTTFLNNFDSYKFQSPGEARTKLAELQKTAEMARKECEDRAEELLTKKRTAFDSDNEAQSKFDSILNTQGCGVSGSATIQYVVQKIDEKIQNMIDYSLLDPNEQGDGFDPSAESDNTLPGAPNGNAAEYKPQSSPTPTESVQQKVTPATIKEEPKILTFAERNPEFPGGDAALMQYFKRNMQYPQMERDNDIQGKVLTKFVVMEDGSVSNVTVVRGVSIGLDNEAVRLVKMLPKFTPGYQNGKPIRVYFNLPVVFKLDNQTNNPAPNANKKQEQLGPSDNVIITADVAYFYSSADLNKVSKNFVTKGTILTKGKETISFYYCFYNDKNNQMVDGYIRKEYLKIYYP